MPALAAPDAPMATVATGMPFGICTVDNSESSPLSALVIGTPITGITVCAATTPARCAAPPAPAMMTSMPRATAPEAYSPTTAGVRCADMTRLSCATPNFDSISPAAFIASQSDLLPMMIPTSGFSFDIRRLSFQRFRGFHRFQEFQRFQRFQRFQGFATIYDETDEINRRRNPHALRQRRRAVLESSDRSICD